MDEAKEIRNKAIALEQYAQQALNTEAGREACEVRLRAERRAGELLIDMKKNGQRKNESGRPEKASTETRLRSTVTIEKSLDTTEAVHAGADLISSRHLEVPSLGRTRQSTEKLCR